MPIIVVHTFKNIRNSPEGWGITSKEPMWTFNLNDVTQNNSYVQLLATPCVFLPWLRDLHQTSTERFVKPAIVHDFWGMKLSLPLARTALPKFD